MYRNHDHAIVVIKDPVCGMTVDPASASEESAYGASVPYPLSRMLFD
jgi:hypothetical protein